MGAFAPTDPDGQAALAAFLDTLQALGWTAGRNAQFDVRWIGSEGEHGKTVAAELVASAPERCVWASNWPHPGRNALPDTASLLDLLLEWADDDATRQRILVDNPARLYGF